MTFAPFCFICHIFCYIDVDRSSFSHFPAANFSLFPCPSCNYIFLTLRVYIGFLFFSIPCYSCLLYLHLRISEHFPVVSTIPYPHSFRVGHWRWRQHILPKWWYLTTRLFSVICQQTVIFIATNVRTSVSLSEVWVTFSGNIGPVGERWYWISRGTENYYADIYVFYA